eukprot:TRINITY_DN30249_c0_g1_i1.p2 TRINITY_DN30249_c0_g1~~TRINITY_DN30249_c0_g1_i1.p2  ORF type:complete len:145 (+),score=14.97 TRINITY_DN30249_c0_g1_i1:412-846(+)
MKIANFSGGWMYLGLIDPDSIPARQRDFHQSVINMEGAKYWAMHSNGCVDKRDSSGTGYKRVQTATNATAGSVVAFRREADRLKVWHDGEPLSCTPDTGGGQRSVDEFFFTDIPAGAVPFVSMSEQVQNGARIEFQPFPPDIGG